MLIAALAFVTWMGIWCTSWFGLRIVEPSAVWGILYILLQIRGALKWAFCSFLQKWLARAQYHYLTARSRLLTLLSPPGDFPDRMSSSLVHGCPLIEGLPVIRGLVEKIACVFAC
jgi:hypothetical protein